MRRDIRSLHIHMPSEVSTKPDLSFDGSSTLNYAELHDCCDQSLWTADRQVTGTRLSDGSNQLKDR